MWPMRQRKNHEIWPLGCGDMRGKRVLGPGQILESVQKICRGGVGGRQIFETDFFRAFALRTQKQDDARHFQVLCDVWAAPL